MKLLVSKETVPREAEQAAIGSRIRLLREQKDISQRELARRLGVSPSYLSAVERGQDKINFDIIRGLLREFGGLNADWLIAGRGARFFTLNYDALHEFKLDINAIEAVREKYFKAIRSSGDASKASILAANEALYFQANYGAYMSHYRDLVAAGVPDNIAHLQAKEFCHTSDPYQVLDFHEMLPVKKD